MLSGYSILLVTSSFGSKEIIKSKILWFGVLKIFKREEPSVLVLFVQK